MRSIHPEQLLLSGILLAVGINLPVQADWMFMGPKAHVESSDVIVVATLVEPREITVDGMDYGRGTLKVHEVLWPADLEARELLLRWSNQTGRVCPRVDPRPHADQPAIWLLTLDQDGTVRADHPERTFLLVRRDANDWADQMWPLTQDPAYGEKVQGLEAFFAEVGE